MPKDLYLAGDMNGLKKKCEIDIPKTTSYLKCLSLMDKMHGLSLTSKRDEDEEMEFFYLHRYLLLSAYLSKAESGSSRNDESFLAKKKGEYARAEENITRYSHLMERLGYRYDEACGKKSKLLSNGNVVQLDSNKIPDKPNKETRPAPSVAAEKGFIECNQLYSLIKCQKHSRDGSSMATKDSQFLLIFDVRSAEDFKRSHVDFNNLLNIPEEIIASDLSAHNLGKKLAGSDKVLWDKRTEADVLVLMDWSTSSSSPRRSSKVFVLQNIIRKWDPSKSYKTTPRILEGGYEEIIERYPFITTNPKVEIPRQPSGASTNTLKNLEYPLEDLELDRPKTAPPPPKPEPLPEVRHSVSASIDRTTKPAVTTTTQVTDENLNTLVYELGDSVINDTVLSPVEPKEPVVPEEPPPPKAPTIEDSSSDEDYPSGSSHPAESKKPNPAVVDNLRKLKPSFNNKNATPNLPRDKGPSMDGDHPTKKPRSATTFNESVISHEPLKRDSSSGGILRRSSSSPNIKEISDDEPLCHQTPSFSRANKPAALKVQRCLYNERADSIHGKTTPGLTGLKNFANNCYMNSILQCLNNTEPLVKELLRLQSSHSVNVGSRLKGRIAQEVIAAFRSMWSGDVKVYSIRELKSLMGDIKDIFKGSMHQDSNEFLIILLEHLHDDLNMPAEVENLVGAVEETGEKAWGEFRRKNCSIIQQLFYGQHRSTVTCSTCGHNSATFEQFFNLFIPIPPGQHNVTLSDCIQLYMSGERINGWKCPSCKAERNATKKFDISRLPPVLIIALKRFTQADGSWLHKKENLVSYPLKDLDMSRFTVPGSEQRCQVYDLYAMSTHSGTLQSGHYRAICKNPLNKKWYMFDDQSVDQLTETSVLTNPEVYIMFYIAKQQS